MRNVHFEPEEILETVQMVQMEKLDIRTITMGISLRDCAHPELVHSARRAYEKICRYAEKLVRVGDELEREYGIPIINRRISVTPIALVAESSAAEDYVPMAQALDRAAHTVVFNFIGGLSALGHKGLTGGQRKLIDALPQALAVTERVAASVNVVS